MVVNEARDTRSSAAPDREVTSVVAASACTSSSPTIAADVVGAIEDGPVTSSDASKKHRLKSRFQVVKKLGQGTYGKVQLAINKETGQEVAIKTIKKSKIETEQDLVRIRREIQIMSSIQHPHIIRIFEVFENKEKIVLVMQYASGGELYEYVSDRKLLGDNEARRLFRQIASAIYYCHKNKICHRDLKLENILLDDKGNAKIGDFGLSNLFDDRHFLNTFCGSPLYASPEIVKGTPYLGPEVDCWSLGVLLYTLVYGAMPFDGSNFKRLVKQISESSYYEPKTNKSKASSLIRKLLTVDPKKRATVSDICSEPWVNEGFDHSLLQIAEDMATLSPVNLNNVIAIQPTTPTTPSSSGNQLEQPSQLLPVQKTPVDGGKLRRLTIAIPAITEETKSEATTPTQLTVSQQQTESSSHIPQPGHPPSPQVTQSPTQHQPVVHQLSEIVKVSPTSPKKTPTVQLLENLPDTQQEVPPVTKKIPPRSPKTEPTSAEVKPPEDSKRIEVPQEKPKEVSSKVSVSKVPSTPKVVAKKKPVDRPKVTLPKARSPPKEVAVKEPPQGPKILQHKIVTESREPSVRPKSCVEVSPKMPESAEARPKPSHPTQISRQSRSVDESDLSEVSLKNLEQRRSSSASRRVGRLSIPNALFEDKNVVTKKPVPSYGSIEDTKKKLLERKDSIDKEKERIYPTIPVHVAKQDVERRASIPDAICLISHGPISGQINRVGPWTMKGLDEGQVGDSQNGRHTPKNMISAVTLKLQQPSTSSTPDALSLSPLPERTSRTSTPTTMMTATMTPSLGDRSESIDTLSSPIGSPSPRYTVEEPSYPSTSRDDRSESLRDNTESENDTDSICSSSMEVAPIRPVPITRSYKKTTFTKDGACVTETGKIISTTLPDGTVTTIERKSKITRFPASPNGDFLGEPSSTTSDVQSGLISQSTSQVSTTTMIAAPTMLSPHTVQVNGADGGSYVGPSTSPSLLSILSTGLSKSESISSAGSMDIFDEAFDSWHGDPIFANMGSMVKRIRNLLPSSHSSLLTRRCSARPIVMTSDTGSLDPREEDSFLPPVAVPESSSLLDQLRAHGYKNMVKQRMSMGGIGGCLPSPEEHALAFPDGEESVRERIHRKSFYRRFNEDNQRNGDSRNGSNGSSSSSGGGRYSRQSSVTRSIFPASFDP